MAFQLILVTLSYQKAENALTSFSGQSQRIFFSLKTTLLKQLVFSQVQNHSYLCRLIHLKF
ncbi:hypothetical protein DDZ16_08390 [Marinilabilia rubra]|uniref:Uncharacterized protein n=1 Tax=Marinilabilia rubra TaxID=2162893 RepID=A0A2U2BA06_9BACT|nr:hypothetical protein DDZ16_08390 [Marinilabilia rubra]